MSPFGYVSTCKEKYKSGMGISPFPARNERFREGGRGVRSLDRGYALFAGADANHVGDRDQEYLAVADLAGARGFGNDSSDMRSLLVRYDDFEFHLLQQVHRIFCAAIVLGKS